MSDGITDGYRMSERSPKDIGRGLDPVPTHFEMGEKGITGERGSIGCMGEVGSPLSENNVDEIEVQDSEKVYACDEPSEQPRETHWDWVQRMNENGGDSFADADSSYKHWTESQQIAYLEANKEWLTSITDPLATYLLENHSEKITGDVDNMYALSIDIMSGKFDTVASQTFQAWDAAYRNGEFYVLGEEGLAQLSKEELVVYITAERKTHQELNAPLYEHVMENHNDSVMQYGSIQAAILDLLRSK